MHDILSAKKNNQTGWLVDSGVLIDTANRNVHMIPLIISHRGGAKEAPENTFLAFDRTIGLQVDGIETDVRMTKDGIPVLYHDETLYKIAKSRKRVSDLTLDQLMAFDFGKWYHPTYKGQKIPIFYEFLKRYIGKTRLLIEIKSSTQDRKTGRAFKLADTIMESLKKPDIEPYRQMVFILSFDETILKYLATKESTFQYVLNLDEKMAKFSLDSEMLSLTPDDISHLSGICVNEKFLSENLEKFVHNSGKLLFTYTINTHHQLNHALQLHVDAVITDRPQWIKQAWLSE